MMKNQNENTWMAGGAAEEQTRFELARDKLLGNMAFCYGQVYLAGEVREVVRTGDVLLCGKEPRLTPSAAVASITVQEKLIAVGHERICSLESAQQSGTARLQEYCCVNQMKLDDHLAEADMNAAFALQALQYCDVAGSESTRRCYRLFLTS